MPGRQAIPIFSRISPPCPDNEQIVTFLVRLRYLDPQQTAGVLGQYIPPNQNSVGFTALQSAGALLITDTARSVRRLVGLINELDLPCLPRSRKDSFALKRAEATKAVEFLNGVFDLKSSGSTPGQPGGVPPTNTGVQQPTGRPTGHPPRRRGRPAGRGPRSR